MSEVLELLKAKHAGADVVGLGSYLPEEDLKLMTNDFEEITIAVYARVSSTKEAQVDAIKYQQETLSHWLDVQCAKHKNWHRGKIYTDTKTGRTFNRTAYKRMMRDVKKDGVNYIIFWETSRFGRNLRQVLKECIYLKDELGIDLYFLDKGIDTRSPDDFKRLFEEASRADEASWQTKLRVDRGISERRMLYMSMNDGYLFTNRCLGLTNKTRQAEGAAKYESKQHLFIVEDEAKTVRDMAEHYLQTGNLSETARWLTENGYKKALDKQAAPNWTADEVSRTLRNPIYIQIEMQGKTRVATKENYYNVKRTIRKREDWVPVYMPNRIPRILDDDVFMRVQDLLDANSVPFGKIDPDKDIAFRRLVWCSCGGGYSLLYKQTEERDAMYHCRYKTGAGGLKSIQRRNKAILKQSLEQGIEPELIDEATACTAANIPEWKLEMVYQEVLKEIGFSLDAAAKGLTGILSKFDGTDEAVMSDEEYDLRDELKEIRSKIIRLNNRYTKGEVDDDEYDAEHQNLIDLRRECEAKIKAYTDKKSENQLSDNQKKLCEEILAKAGTADDYGKNYERSGVLHGIYVREPNSFDVVLNFRKDVGKSDEVPEQFAVHYKRRLSFGIMEYVYDSRKCQAEFDIDENRARIFKKQNSLGKLKRYQTIHVRVLY